MFPCDIDPVVAADVKLVTKNNYLTLFHFDYLQVYFASKGWYAEVVQMKLINEKTDLCVIKVYVVYH